MKRWYAIGPVQTVDDPVEGGHQCAPDGCVGWIDTRPVAGEVASGFFAFDAKPTHLSETHTIIGDGTRLEEYYPSLAERSAWASAYAVPVNSASDTLLQMLVSLLTEQADPDGYERCRPLTVNHRGEYEIHLGGHSRIYRSKFAGEQDRLWPNLQRLWQSELSKTHAAEARRGKDPGVQTGKMLAELARLHKCPAELLTPKELKGLKTRKPTTRIYDDFERAELGANWIPRTNGDWWIGYNATYGWGVAGQLTYGGDGSGWPINQRMIQHVTPLSSANQRVGVEWMNGLTAWIGPIARMNAIDLASYKAYLRSGGGTVDSVASNGAATAILSSTAEPVAGDLIAVSVDGSTVELLQNAAVLGSVTNTAVPSGPYTGVNGHPSLNNSNNGRITSFEARDLLVASIPPFLLNMRAV